MSKVVRAFVDFRSPYSYIAMARLWGRGVPVDVTLIDVLSVMERVNNQPTPRCRPKLKYTQIDTVRSAADAGVEYAPNQGMFAAFGNKTLSGDLLLRAGIAAGRLDRPTPIYRALFKSIWASADNLTSPEARNAWLDQRAIDAPTLWQDAEGQWTAEQLVKNNEEAIAKGVFGVPTMFVDDEIFFGNDRADMVLRRLDQENAA